MPVLATARTRTRSGRWRAQNMMSRAPTNGAQVIAERTGSALIAPTASGPGGPARPATGGPCPRSSRPLAPDQEEEDPERHAVHVVLGPARLDAPEAVARRQRP